MAATNAPGRNKLATSLVVGASRYWLDVFPAVCREMRRWRVRAEAIPDPKLRTLALQAQATKRSNIEGSAAFGAFAPRTSRPAVIRAQVAFRAIYDYVDTLSEQPHQEPTRNARQLHQALLAALGDTRTRNYYAYHPNDRDAGYLNAIVDACRSAFFALPAHRAIAASAQRIVERIVSYQSLNLNRPQGGPATA